MTATAFASKTVVVTGAAGLIGRRCGEAFAEQGARVAAVDLVPFSASTPEVLALTADLRDEEDLELAFDCAEAELGAVDVLVQCAAVVRRVPFLEITSENIDHIFAVNVRAMLLAARCAAASMVRDHKRGVIVNLASTSAVLSDAQSVAYDASKGAVAMATRAAAVALGAHGIRVVAVAPGCMTREQERPTRAPDLDDYERRRIPIGRLATATDVAEAVVFLASPQAAYITGTVLYVDGGSLATW